MSTNIAQMAFTSGFGPYMVPVSPPHGQGIDIRDRDMGKAPGIRYATGEWKAVAVSGKFCISMEEADLWDGWGANTGVACGRDLHLNAIDNDTDDPFASQIIHDVIRAKLPGAYERGVDYPGHVRRLFPVRVREGAIKGINLRWTHPDGRTASVQVLSEGQQFVGWGTHKKTGLVSAGPGNGRRRPFCFSRTEPT
jgi:hypothetical protein